MAIVTEHRGGNCEVEPEGTSSRNGFGRAIRDW